MDAQKLPIGALGEHTPAVLLQRMALSAHQDAATGCIPSFTNRQTEALSEFHKGYLKGVEEANEKMKLVQEAAAEPPSPEEACLYVIELAQDVGLSLKSAHALASYFAAEMEQEGIE
jgi:basic membrane lipoprotein Med (substrate-binding protein (PBP1-ABC) superfamily)